MTTVFITGVGRGIGLELAKGSLKRGWTVFGSCRSADQADKLSQTLGTDFHPLVFDVTNFSKARAEIGSLRTRIDILINNAGIIGPPSDRQTTLTTDTTAFLKTIEVNTLAPLIISQACLPWLRQSERPRILSISSRMSAMTSTLSDRIAYRASKAALNKVMQGLATDLLAEGIAVLLVDPGWVQTDMGGAKADNPADAVAAGILSLADKANMEMSGKFYLWSGDQREF